MSDYVVRFVRDDTRKRTWYINEVFWDSLVHYNPSPDYRWKFYNEAMTRKVIRGLARFNLKASQEITPERTHVISVSFRTYAAEAEFMMLALSDQITLTFHT